MISRPHKYVIRCVRVARKNPIVYYDATDNKNRTVCTVLVDRERIEDINPNNMVDIYVSTENEISIYILSYTQPTPQYIK